MKILFLCGCLEPGRDGVGDYTRQLASELVYRGHEATIVALSDGYLVESLSSLQKTGTISISVLRLPAAWSMRERFAKVQQWAEDLVPDWVSLQFVPYAFHTKGLPVFMIGHLRRLVQGRRVHLMVHESWVGAEPGVGLKRQLLSTLQRLLLKSIVSKTQPSVIHTHLPFYYTQLAKLHCLALPLPLFSNIPVAKRVPCASVRDSSVFRVGIFSQLDANSTLIDFLIELEQHVAQSNCLFQLLLIGGEATRMQALQDALARVDTFRDNVQYTGFLEPAQLSAALQTCDLGLTTVPRHALGKSGSVAAFLAHGIPVAAPIVHNAAKAGDIGFFSTVLRSSILIYPNTTYLQAAKASAWVAKEAIHVSAITQTFLEDLACR